MFTVFCTCDKISPSLQKISKKNKIQKYLHNSNCGLTEQHRINAASSVIILK